MNEVIFIGLPGPYHNYGGLAPGNVASADNAGNISHPKEAALQAIELIRELQSSGIMVGLLPPQPRPDINTLQKLGFRGTAEKIIKDVAKYDLKLLAMFYSSAAMWAANAATITPAKDASDGRTHITPANLTSNLHRSVEAKYNTGILRRIFNQKNFIVHDPLPEQMVFADEGAANHMRLSPTHGDKGLNIFIYGREGLKNSDTKKYPPRQSLQASEAIARKHGIPDKQSLMLKQNPKAIDAGVFHNDVVAVSNENLMLYHQQAFEDKKARERISKSYKALFKIEPVLIEVTEKELPLAVAVKTYFFNSQVITVSPGNMKIIVPIEVKENAVARKLLEKIIKDKTNPVKSASYIDLRQSMKNGGGPACLRLRVVMDEQSIRAKKTIFLTEQKVDALEKLIKKTYPVQLKPTDLGRGDIYYNTLNTLSAINKIIGF